MISRTEKFLVLAVFLILTVFHTVAQSRYWYKGYGDNAFLAQFLETIAETGKPLSQINATVYSLFPLLTKDPQTLLDGEFKAPVPKQFNQFRKHTYLISYVLAPLTYVMSGPVVLSLLKVLSFLGLSCAAYFFLRSRRLSIPLALLFCLLVSVHPVWNDGLWGQMYVDRLIMPLAFLLLFSISDPKRLHAPIFIALALLCTITTDRAGFICGAAVFGYTMLNYRKHDVKSLRLLLSVSLLMMVFSFVVMKYYLDNPDYANISSRFSPIGFLNTLAEIPLLKEKLAVFLLVNIGLFWWLSLPDIRAALIALGAMLPNVIGYIGGGEKCQFLLHYHALYFPVLVWAAASGVVVLASQTNRLRYLPYFLVASLIVLLLSRDTDKLDLDAFSLNRLKSPSLLRPLLSYDEFVGKGSMAQFARDRQQLDASIPRGTVVSAIEELMPSLYHDREIHLYPMGIDDADFVVLPAEKDKEGRPFYPGAATYLTGEDKMKYEQGLNERLARNGFDVAAPSRVGSWAILSRKPENGLSWGD